MSCYSIRQKSKLNNLYDNRRGTRMKIINDKGKKACILIILL